jgi:hypothetical protein
VFDTFVSQAESARLADFVGRITTGRIVVAAIRDDGVGQLTDDAVRALRSLGAGWTLAAPCSSRTCSSE